MADKIKKETIHAKGLDIGIYTYDFKKEYISLTDIAKYSNKDDPRFPIQNWMRNRNTIEYLSIWEELHNPNFNRVQFEAVKEEAGLNRFVMTPTKWINEMNSIGIVVKAGRQKRCLIWDGSINCGRNLKQTIMKKCRPGWFRVWGACLILRIAGKNRMYLSVTPILIQQKYSKKSSASTKQVSMSGMTRESRRETNGQMKLPMLWQAVLFLSS